MTQIPETLQSAAVLLQEGKLAEADALCRRILETHPGDFNTLHLAAIVASYTADFARADALFTAALATGVASAQAFANHSGVLIELARYDAALRSAAQAIALDSEQPIAHTNRGVALGYLGRYGEAVESYDKALALGQGSGLLHTRRGDTLTALGRLDDALASFHEAARMSPDVANAHYNLGAAFARTAEPEAALRSFERAAALDPGHAAAQFAIGFHCLLLQDFERGWRQFEWRWEVGKSGLTDRGFSQPPWRGVQPLHGKTILLHCEQGFGDTIQFCRYVPLVAARGGRVILEVQPGLVALLRDLEGVTEIIARGETRPPFDLHCPLLSLPLAFKTSAHNTPAPLGYIRSRAEKRDHWRQLLGPRVRPRLGISWSGNPNQVNDRNRSLSLEEFLKAVPAGFDLVSLQKDVRDQDRQTLSARPDIRDLGAILTDFSDTAAVCDLVDAVVSVDTSLAHLAGAMGTDLHILLHAVADWRYYRNRSDSPWYPTARLYRQPRPGDWASVFAAVKADLERIK